MKVRCIRTHARDIEIGSTARAYFDSMYDLGAPTDEKTYPPAKIGYESFVYAIIFRQGNAYFYIREPGSSYISHAPSVCFEILNSRASKYWHIKHDYVERIGRRFPFENVYPRTLLAIEEWVNEPRFLERYVDGNPREVEIMEKAARLIEEE